mgnify:FL=1
MGWWGTGVMEGDEPMDLEYVIREALLEGVEVNECDDDSSADEEEARLNVIVADKLKKGEYKKILADMMAGDGEFGDFDREIAIQVLGEMIMCYGGTMSDDDKAIFRGAAENDDWAQGDDKRHDSMLAYIDRINSYAGIALEPTSHSLLDTIFQHMVDEKNGLVNK